MTKITIYLAALLASATAASAQVSREEIRGAADGLTKLLSNADVAVACDLRDKAWEKKVIAGAGVAIRLAVIADHPDLSEDEIKSAADRIGWSAISRSTAAHAEHPTAAQCSTANNELSSLDKLANLGGGGGQ